MEGKKYLLLDLDNTLVATKKIVFSRFVYCADELGIEITDQDLKILYSKLGSPDRIRETEADLPHISSNFWGLYTASKCLFRNHPIGNIKQTIERLKNKSRGVCVLTNERKSKSIEKLKLCGVGIEDLCFLQTREECEFLKPDSRFFYGVIGVLGREYLAGYIGDDLEDYYAAQGAGIPFYGVLTGLTSKQDFINQGLNPAHIFEDIHMFERYFQH